MIILPAIDIRGGNCVRLYQGKADQETVYSDDPIQMAHLWKAKGAQMLHVVDLDGAFEGTPVNLKLIGLLRKEVGIPVEVGGGFRDMDVIRQAVEQGIDRIILGTVAIRKPELVCEAVEEFPGMIAVSIDVSGAFATAAGWKEISSVSFSDLAAQMRDLGIEELLFTDTRRDGTLLGPDIPVIRSFLTAAQVPVTVSGGVTSLEDLTLLKQLESEGLKGVVIGKALYDKKIQLEDALKLC
jgi:phosphoribosylformimino-5-aminoimidazole carboxamide ribotide isomerase